MAEQIKKDGSVGQSVKVACAGTCSGITRHTIMASMDKQDEYQGIDWWANYQVIMCQGCEKLSFRQASGSSEDCIEIAENEWDLNECVQLYPARKADSRGLGDDLTRLPDAIALLYIETRTTLLNSSPVLTGIGLRALVETVCKEKMAPGENLQKRIDGLVGMGVLTKADADVLHEIRSMGNEAAHETKPHSDEQLSLAMEVVEHLLKSVYIIPFKLKKFAKPMPLLSPTKATPETG